jgi:LuxR family maltose regulon positive regulatory protein
LRFLCQGIPNKEMATRLFVSENTIKFHLKNIYAKLDVRNRSQAIIAARERCLHR